MQDRYRQIAADYLQALKDKKSVLVVSPDPCRSGQGHAGHPLGAASRREAGEGRAGLYPAGGGGQCFGSGTRAGDHLPAGRCDPVPPERQRRLHERRPADRHRSGRGAAVGSREVLALPAGANRPVRGRKIRFTGTVKTLDGEHKLKNGATSTVAGFTKAGDIKLDNGWVVSKDAGHFRPGFVETSFGSQGRTVQRVILAVAETSLPATNQQQMYVGASRAKRADDALYRQQGGGAGGGATQLAEAGRIGPAAGPSQGQRQDARAEAERKKRLCATSTACGQWIPRLPGSISRKGKRKDR